MAEADRRRRASLTQVRAAGRAHARRFLLRVLLCAGIGAAVPLLADAADVGPPTEAQRPPQPGMRAYVDPQTGEFAEPPAGASSAAATTNEAFSRSSSRLVETQGTTPAGGVKVDLRGRFLSTFAATVDAAGKPAAGCRSTGLTAGQE
jgi:hypothetical protein